MADRLDFPKTGAAAAPLAQGSAATQVQIMVKR